MWEEASRGKGWRKTRRNRAIRSKAFFGRVYPQGFPGGSDSKESSFYAGDPSLIPGLGRPWVGKIPWRREWLPTPVFLSGDFKDREVWWVTDHETTKSWT